MDFCRKQSNFLQLQVMDFKNSYNLRMIIHVVKKTKNKKKKKKKPTSTVHY